MSFMAPPKKKKVIFFGDSITQSGIKPNGYITKMDSIIRRLNKPDSVQLIGAGLSGNKITDLYLRMQQDVLDKHPDVVVIFIGINDVWHKRTFGTGTDADKFEKFYRAIIKKLQEQNIKLLICTPTVVGERYDHSNELDGDLNRYADIIRKMGKELSIPVCDLRTAFMEYLKTNNKPNEEKGILTTDRVHLTDQGNLFVAEEMWKHLQKIIL